MKIIKNAAAVVPAVVVTATAVLGLGLLISLSWWDLD